MPEITQNMPGVVPLLSKGKIVVICGPVGSGATTVSRELTKRLLGTVKLITATTRFPKQGEVRDVDYHFFTDTEFTRYLEKGDIIEYSFVSNRNVYYGTYLPTLKKALQDHPIVFANVDITGTRFFKEHYDALSIFIFPESGSELQERLRSGNPTISEGELNSRLQEAHDTVSAGTEDFDHVVSNPHGKMHETVDKIVAILKKEGYLQ